MCQTISYYRGSVGNYNGHKNVVFESSDHMHAEHAPKLHGNYV